MRKPPSLPLLALFATMLVAAAALFHMAAQDGAPTTSDTPASHAASLPDSPDAASQANENPSKAMQEDPVSGQSPDSSDGGQADDDPVFVMPQDAVYEPQVVLVKLPEGMTQEELDSALGELPGVRGARESAEGIVSVEVDDSVTVEDAVNRLLDTGRFDVVQPNYIYTMLFDEGEGPALLSQELAAHGLGALDDGDPATEAGPEASRADADSSEPVEPSDAADVADSVEQAGAADAADVTDPEGATDPADVASPADAADQTDAAGAAGATDQTDAAAQADAADPTAQADPADPTTSLDLTQALQVNDPLAPKQYMLDNVLARQAWAIARAQGDTAGRPVTVALLDLAFETHHEDLADNVVYSYNALDGGSDVSSSYTSGVSHGNLAASVVSARVNNGLGVAGVSYNAQLALVRVADDRGGASTLTLANAYDNLMERASDLNLRVVNISMGAQYSIGKYSQQDLILMGRVDKAYAAGIVTVAAAGNSSSSVRIPGPMFPSDLDNVVGVINVDRDYQRKSTSNYNVVGERRKNIAAPGDAIVGAGRTSESYTYDGVTYRGYTTKGGTSFSSPCVAAILALEFAANPSLTPEQATNILYATATDIGATGWDRETGYGEATAYDAVRAATGATIEGPRNVEVGASGIAYAVTGEVPSQAGGQTQRGSWTFASSDPSVLRVNAQTGTAQALASGTASVTATNASGSSLVKVVQVYTGVQGEQTVECGDDSAEYVVNGGENVLQSWTWSTSDPTVATIGSDTGVLTPVRAGTITVTATLVADPSMTMSMRVQITGTSMLRLYNPNSGEHFYTADEAERNMLVREGWYFEGIGWVAPTQSSKPVYRLYNSNASEHHYTMDASERDMLVQAGWNNEGIGWYSDTNETVPVLREYNPNEFACNHNFTTDVIEHNMLVELGWHDEGVAWYALAPGDKG